MFITKKNTMDEFVAQLTPVELEAVLRGDYTKVSPLGCSGNASVYGGTIKSLRGKGVEPVSTVDGPSGIHMGLAASLIPIGTMLACTWNNGLVEKIHNILGEELGINGADVLLGPGINIHRNPLCGRNFEYFSEDPVLTGRIAAAAVKGIQYGGASPCIKHFALNNQETNRTYNDSVASERAQREIYMRGYEICVKEAKPYNIMGSYNMVNGVYSYYNYDMCTTMLRNDWNYEGVLMTDWWLKEQESSELFVKNNAYRIRAQMDVNMPGEGPAANDTSLLDSYNNWVAAGSPENEIKYGITLGEMQRSAKNVLNFVMKSRIFRAKNNLSVAYEPGEEWFDTNESGWQPKPQLIDITIDGIDFAAFNPGVTNYDVFVRDMSDIPKISATANAGAQVIISQATESNNTAVIKLTENGGQNIYYINFSDTAGMEPVVSNPKYAKVKNIEINGKSIAAFYPALHEYRLKGDINNIDITVSVPDNVSYKINKRAEDNMVVIRAETDDHAVEYVLKFGADGTENTEYSVTDINSAGNSKLWAVNTSYRSDELQNFECIDNDNSGYYLGNTRAGCYALYRINIKESGYYDISTRVASNEKNTVAQLDHIVEIDGDIAGVYSPNPTGGEQAWVTTPANRTYIERGEHIVRVRWQSAINLNYIEFTAIDQEMLDAKNTLKTNIDKAYIIDKNKCSENDYNKMINILAEAIAVYEGNEVTAETYKKYNSKLVQAVESLK